MIDENLAFFGLTVKTNIYRVYWLVRVWVHGWGRKGELTLKFPRREQNIGPYIQVPVEGGGVNMFSSSRGGGGA